MSGLFVMGGLVVAYILGWLEGRDYQRHTAARPDSAPTNGES